MTPLPHQYRRTQRHLSNVARDQAMQGAADDAYNEQQRRVNEDYAIAKLAESLSTLTGQDNAQSSATARLASSPAAGRYGATARETAAIPRSGELVNSAANRSIAEDAVAIGEAEGAQPLARKSGEIKMRGGMARNDRDQMDAAFDFNTLPGRIEERLARANAGITTADADADLAPTVAAARKMQAQDAMTLAPMQLRQGIDDLNQQAFLAPVKYDVARGKLQDELSDMRTLSAPRRDFESSRVAQMSKILAGNPDAASFMTLERGVSPLLFGERYQTPNNPFRPSGSTRPKGTMPLDEEEADLFRSIGTAR